MAYLYPCATNSVQAVDITESAERCGGGSCKRWKLRWQWLIMFTQNRHYRSVNFAMAIESVPSVI